MPKEPTAQPSRLGLADVLKGLRQDLLAAMAAAADDGGVTFPVESAEVVIHVGVTRQADAKGGVHVWVVELGGGGSYSRDEIQTVTLRLGAPVDAKGRPVRVARPLAEKP